MNDDWCTLNTHTTNTINPQPPTPNTFTTHNTPNIYHRQQARLQMRIRDRHRKWKEMEEVSQREDLKAKPEPPRGRQREHGGVGASHLASLSTGAFHDISSRLKEDKTKQHKKQTPRRARERSARSGTEQRPGKDSEIVRGKAPSGAVLGLDFVRV